MQQEIERKFLVKSQDFIQQSSKQCRMVQAYLNSDKARTVRVRIAGEQAFITVKGPSNNSGTSRLEWEKEITVAEGEALLTLCEPSPIEKTRYYVPIDKVMFEVDVFTGENAGLIIAEVELEHELQEFPRPSWLAKEVTGEKCYYNSKLSLHPFAEWG